MSIGSEIARGFYESESIIDRNLAAILSKDGRPKCIRLQFVGGRATGKYHYDPKTGDIVISPTKEQRQLPEVFVTFEARGFQVGNFLEYHVPIEPVKDEHGNYVFEGKNAKQRRIGTEVCLANLRDTFNRYNERARNMRAS